MRHVQRRLVFPAALALALAAAGCGQSLETSEVEGVVRIGGKPTKGLMVQFMPDPAKNTQGPTSTGETDEQGRYRLRYSLPNSSSPSSGAVVGWHRVVVTDMEHAPAPQGQAPKPGRVSTHFAEVATTPLSKEVQRGKQTIDLEVTP